MHFDESTSPYYDVHGTIVSSDIVRRRLRKYKLIPRVSATALVLKLISSTAHFGYRIFSGAPPKFLT